MFDQFDDDFLSEALDQVDDALLSKSLNQVETTKKESQYNTDKKSDDSKTTIIIEDSDDENEADNEILQSDPVNKSSTLFHQESLLNTTTDGEDKINGKYHVNEINRPKEKSLCLEKFLKKLGFESNGLNVSFKMHSGGRADCTGKILVDGIEYASKQFGLSQQDAKSKVMESIKKQIHREYLHRLSSRGV